MENELQNNEIYLPGDLGSIQFNGIEREIKSVFKDKKGAVTLTIGEKITPLVYKGYEIKGIKAIHPEKIITINDAHK